ncbi:MAG: hypothetical protein WAW17_12945 [Rhodococcus sp. (in: high G+C Gram-positive bacteria)]|uniref:hypothetical protein n=1 Tax=Rhodococcus sp. TaxID=1831 RepID=UPI003BAF8C44
MSSEVYVYDETRWQCAGCRRFVKDSAVGGEDIWDPIDSYYGFRSYIWADCKVCGRVDDPICLPVKSHTYTAPAIEE